MELTKQDKKHIEVQVRKLSFRIVQEAKEYMRLYEKTYYKKVIEMFQARIDDIDYLQEQTLKISNNETQAGEENNGVVQRKWRPLHNPQKKRQQTQFLQKVRASQTYVL